MSGSASKKTKPFPFGRRLFGSTVKLFLAYFGKSIVFSSEKCHNRGGENEPVLRTWDSLLDQVALREFVLPERRTEMAFFEERKKLGFGLMRLPRLEGNEIDIPQLRKMVDEFLAAGFNYFDTAHGYHSGKSELAIREALTSRYPRDRYSITDKLTAPYFQKESDIRPFFQSQLEAVGVEYFDYYLMHAQNASVFEKFKQCRAYETAFALKEEGKIRHVGISFHDTAEVLDRILTEYPQIEVVQIQFNYLDYNDPAVQSKLCYDVCVKHQKPVIIMEPIKGGSLIHMPETAMSLVKGLGVSPANLALRFAASQEQVMMVLSGMSNEEQLHENVSFMSDFCPLSEKETKTAFQIADIIHSKGLIPCTACRYCTDGCPMKISIPDLFACMNSKLQFHNWNADFYYSIHTKSGGKAGDCIRCGQCEQICPQHLPIRELLSQVANEFED